MEHAAPDIASETSLASPGKGRCHLNLPTGVRVNVVSDEPDGLVRVVYHQVVKVILASDGDVWGPNDPVYNKSMYR